MTDNASSSGDTPDSVYDGIALNPPRKLVALYLGHGTVVEIRCLMRRVAAVFRSLSITGEHNPYFSRNIQCFSSWIISESRVETIVPDEDVPNQDRRPSKDAWCPALISSNQNPY